MTMELDVSCDRHRHRSFSMLVDGDDEGVSTMQQSPVDPMQLLPTELGVHLLGLLADEDLCRASQVSRRWHRLTESSVQLRTRRQRHVAFMRHAWSVQKQNFVTGKRCWVALQSSASSGRTASGRTATSSFGSGGCGSCSVGDVQSEVDDEVFCHTAVLPSSLSSRRPLAERQLYHMHPVNAFSAVGSTPRSEWLHRTSAAPNRTRMPIETTSDGGSQQQQQQQRRTSSNSSAVATAVVTSATCPGDELMRTIMAKSEAESDRKRRLRRL
jgi:hypothetical protein